MKKSLNIFLLLLLSANLYSQTSVETQPLVVGLDQYLWSFSKNKAIPGQKTIIDFNAIDNWQGMGYHLAVTDDGKYFSYSINKPSVDYRGSSALNNLDSLVVQSTQNSWRRAFAASEEGFFTADGKQYIFKNSDSLCLLQLGSMQQKLVPGIADFKSSEGKWLAWKVGDKDGLHLQNLLTGKEKQLAATTDYNFSENGEWLICQNSDKELTLHNLANGIENKYPSVDAYVLAKNESALLLKIKTGSANSLDLVTLPSGMVKTIWSGSGKAGIAIYKMDASGKQVLFTVVDSGDLANTGIWYYETGMDKAILKTTAKTIGVPAGLTVADISFTGNGRCIQLSLQARAETAGNPSPNIAGLEVWNYKDMDFQSAQSVQAKFAKSYNAILNIESGKIVFLESNDRKLSKLDGDFAIIKNDLAETRGDRFWRNEKDSSWLLSLKDGSIQLLPTRSQQFWFSPDQKWLVYLEAETGFHYFSYNLHTKELIDISPNVPRNQFAFFNRSDATTEITMNSAGGLAAWIENTETVLAYDNYDIWKLDLTGKQNAVNITNGFGQSHNTILNLFSSGRFYKVPTVKANAPLILRAYNTNNKQTGFYKKLGLDAGTPTELYNGGYFMNKIDDWHALNMSSAEGMGPVKAKKANTWIVQRQSANDAPNYYETSDFKNFKRLTNFQPQSGFQWLTEELITFKCLDGTICRGILYKPENFDPKRKYPVLIPFYENFSDNMNQFPVPFYLNDAIQLGVSPAWFLNNGYLVFTPDIMKTGPTAFNILEGAVQHLEQLPYVDANKLGCASHSQSGKLGAYFFTHSTSIAATTMSEGFAYGNALDQAFGELTEDGRGRLDGLEVGAHFGNLWDNKDAWLDRTIILNVDKANSPLLLQASSEPSRQTLQLFSALRRLEKKVWWLKYDEGGHVLLEHKQLQDYTIRYTQFFDHYLKNAPAPLWMTKGIPYKLKGIESRYELDPSGTCSSPGGEPCPICGAWNAQYKRTPQVFQKEIKDWSLDKDIAAEMERSQNEKRKQLDKQGEIQTKEVMKMLEMK